MIARINQTTLRLCIDTPLIYPVATPQRRLENKFGKRRPHQSPFEIISIC
nr:MAG TPA: hypothetical protein [Bacteriophage sp.]